MSEIGAIYNDDGKRVARYVWPRKKTAEVDPNQAECTCHPTDPATWTTYGSAVEPGSMFEPDPDCPRHR